MVQAPQSSIFSRKIVNLFAGMAYGAPDLPRVFYSRGYVCHAIEPKFSVAIQRQINPEIILCSETDKHTLIVEAKSGANLNPAQLERYKLITESSLITQAFTSPSAAKNHDILIVGRAQMSERLQIGSALVPSNRRILAVACDDEVTEESDRQTQNNTEDIPQASDCSGIRRLENSFATLSLNDAFNPLLEIDWELVPNTFLPVDHESENWEFAQFIFPDIIAAILEGTPTLRVDELAKSFIRHWEFIAAAYRKTLLDRIRVVIKLAAQKRFSPYIEFGTKGSSKNEVKLMIPEDLNENRGRVRAQLQRRFRELMDDLNSPQIAMIYED